MRILPILALSLVALPAAADNLRGFYAGAGLNFIDGNTVDADGNDTQFRAGEIHGGYKYNSWLGGEMRVGFGVSSESYAVNIADVGEPEVIVESDVSIDHYESIYYRAESANTVAKLYGLLGFSNVQTSYNDESASDSGFSYGFGVGFVMNEDANLNFEYRSLIDADGGDFTTFAIGFDYRF